MEKQFVPYNLSLKLENLGFKEKCLATIRESGYIHINGTKSYPGGAVCENIIPCPLWQQALNFLYLNSNGKINFIIEGCDNYKTLCKKLEQTLKDFRNL